MIKTLFNDYLTLNQAKELIVNDANVNEINSYGNTPLLIAVQRRSRGLIKLFLENKAIPDLPGSRSVLLTALKFRLHINLIKLLIQNGANVNSIDHDKGYSVLDYAKHYMNIDDLLIILLIKHGAKEHISKDLLPKKEPYTIKSEVNKLIFTKAGIIGVKKSETIYNYDGNDKLTKETETTYVYDDEGNCTSSSSVTM